MSPSDTVTPATDTANPAQPLESPTPGEIAALEPVEKIKRRWPVYAAGGLTVLMVLGLGRELLGEGLIGLRRTIPASPLFYIAFLLTYLSGPFFDWLIFRRLWGLPLSGLVALLKKTVANGVVVGYGGDAYFYAWARAKLKFVTAPFGAVKDVTILSAIAGNLTTLAMMAIVLPLAKDLLPPDGFRIAMGSAGIIVATSLPFLVFSRRVFSLARSVLWWIFGMHCTRIFIGEFLTSVTLHFAMPEVSLWMWLFLSAARLLVNRLPLVPNKDLLFANFAIILIGRGEALSDLIAFSAALTLLTHMAMLVLFGIGTLYKRYVSP